MPIVNAICEMVDTCIVIEEDLLTVIHCNMTGAVVGYRNIPPLALAFVKSDD
jgi:hypothetical protein